MTRLEPGSFHPLGATWDGQGVNFALFSEHATAVELCLFDEERRETRLNVPWRSVYVWHAYVPGLRPGQRYGWRVHGPFVPREGHRFNPHKLLLDPYARAIDGAFDPRGAGYGSRVDAGGTEILDERDDAAGKPLGVVTGDSFDWGDDRSPLVPWRDTVLYELHVKGFTRRHPAVAEPLRGTYLGLASDAAIDHLRSLGVTTVELMPVHEHLDEPAVTARGLTNYWGYSTLAFFAPDRRFATAGGDPAREFKEMVRRLHAAGIEVVLDVVYNHSCEGDADGPTVSLRGIDNRAYYRLEDDDRSRYVDFTGCGNTLDATHPQVLKLVTDSLRYWVDEMHVDGFRFDLAPALARGTDGDVDRVSTFFAVVHQDPVLSRIKLIAEPWDVGHGGYQVGNFPVLWSEWNGRYRDTARSFWRGDRSVVADLGTRLSG
jgi:isoamylase